MDHVTVATKLTIACRLDIKAIAQVDARTLLFQPGAHAPAIAHEKIDDLRSADDKSRKIVQADAFRAFFLDPSGKDLRGRLNRHKRHAHNNTLLDRQLRELSVAHFRRGERICSRCHQRENQ